MRHECSLFWGVRGSKGNFSMYFLCCIKCARGKMRVARKLILHVIYTNFASAHSIDMGNCIQSNQWCLSIGRTPVVAMAHYGFFAAMELFSSSIGTHSNSYSTTVKVWCSHDSAAGGHMASPVMPECIQKPAGQDWVWCGRPVRVMQGRPQGPRSHRSMVASAGVASSESSPFHFASIKIGGFVSLSLRDSRHKCIVDEHKGFALRPRLRPAILGPNRIEPSVLRKSGYSSTGHSSRCQTIFFAKLYLDSFSRQASLPKEHCC